jgi:hypothetical protein
MSFMRGISPPDDQLKNPSSRRRSIPLDLVSRDRCLVRNLCQYTILLFPTSPGGSLGEILLRKPCRLNLDIELNSIKGEESERGTVPGPQTRDQNVRVENQVADRHLVSCVPTTSARRFRRHLSPMHNATGRSLVWGSLGGEMKRSPEHDCDEDFGGGLYDLAVFSGQVLPATAFFQTGPAFVPLCRSPPMSCARQVRGHGILVRRVRATGARARSPGARWRKERWEGRRNP